MLSRFKFFLFQTNLLIQNIVKNVTQKKHFQSYFILGEDLIIWDDIGNVRR